MSYVRAWFATQLERVGIYLPYRDCVAPIGFESRVLAPGGVAFTVMGHSSHFHICW